MYPFHKDAVEPLLHLAGEAAKTAGAALVKNKQDWRVINEDSRRDIKLQADQEAEKIIIDHLRNRSSFPILAEERGWQNQEGHTPETFWVVDPLDGTANFFSDIPFCGPAIALIHQKRPILGAIYDIGHDELFMGGAGVGASLNGNPLAVSNIAEKSAAKLMTGFPARRDFSDEAMFRFAKEAALWKKVRMMGSAALSLAYVAAGRAEAYHEENIMMWDIAAGWAIVEGAGGKVTVQQTAADQPVTVSAGNGLVCVTL